jgi:hypothetical protein
LAVRRGCENSPTPNSRNLIEPLRNARQVTEPNVAKYIWGHLKQYEIAKLCAKNLAELTPLFATTALDATPPAVDRSALGLG